MPNRDTYNPEQQHAEEQAGEWNPRAKRRFKPFPSKKGRPKGARNRRTIVKEVAREVHVIMENGVSRKRSTLGLVLLSLLNSAIKNGNVQAIEELHRILKVYRPEASGESGGCLVVPAEVTPAEWIVEVKRVQEKRERQREEKEKITK